MAIFPTYLTTRKYQVGNNTAMPQLKLGHCGQTVEVDYAAEWVLGSCPSFMDCLCTLHWTAVGCLTTTTILQPADQHICLGSESLRAAC